jgi:hypothetical protein
MRAKRRSERVVRAACILTIAALGLIVWSVLDPRPLPVILAMSAAQGIGTLSFVAFLVVVLADLRRSDRPRR